MEVIKVRPQDSNKLLQEDQKPGIRFEWKDLGYFIDSTEKEDKRFLLQNLDGVVEPGQVLAVMGPSGSGKSTFLDVISGRKLATNVTGEILLNGVSNPKALKRVSGYVLQDDSLLGNLTVRENILFSALFSMKSNIPYQIKKQRVETIINEFGLKRVADSYIGTPIVRGISGGEQRRTSIACQLVTTPQIIFLDEPTSGLDSAASLHTMQKIVDLAKQYNLTVIATIHQPSYDTFKLFDKLMLLGSGKLLYFGESDKVVPYFAKALTLNVPQYANPPEFLLNYVNADFIENETEAKQRIENVAETYIQNKWSSQTKPVMPIFDFNEAKGLKHSSLYQTAVLVWRGLINARRNVFLYWIRLAMYICLALLMGTTWFKVGNSQNGVQDRISAIFFAVAFLSFMSVAGIPAFLEERQLVVREFKNNAYGLGPYMISNFIISIPFLFLISIVFSAIAYPMISLKSGADSYFTFTGFLYLALLVADSLTVLVSSLLPLFVAALAITAFTNGLFMVVQGYFVRKNNIPDGWIWAHYIDYQKYTFEAMMKNDFSGQTFNCAQTGSTCFCNYDSSTYTASQCKYTGDDVLNYLGYDGINLGLYALWLLIMLVVYRVGAYIIMRYKLK